MSRYGRYFREYVVHTPQFRRKAYNQMNFSHQHGQRVVDNYFANALTQLEVNITEDLNKYERRHPRRDPLMLFSTDQWETVCYMEYRTRAYSVLHVNCTNYQEPYKYPGKPYKIGNLAAVRLDQAQARVYPQKAQVLMWWQDGHYLFTNSRRKSAGGHKRYKRSIDDILVRNVMKFDR